jgi:hypothetical protein
MLKLHSLIALVSIASLNFTYCMLSEFKYTPWKQCVNDEVSKKREEINELSERGEETKIVDVVIRKATEQEQEWKCFNYAMHKITGNTTPLQLKTICDKNMCIIAHMASIDIEKFFDQIQGPEKGALGLYTDDARRIQHFVIVIDNVTFESKWGPLDIIQHKPFDVPDHYGNMISFWKLKEEFTTPEGKELLLETIKKDAKTFDRKFERYLRKFRLVRIE